MVTTYNVDDFGQNPKTLGDWVKNFRLKKIQMKRKLRSGGNLRVCAILSTALLTAELELRRKQQERFQKWLEFQTKININHELQPKNELHHHHLRNQKHLQHQENKELILVSEHNEEMNCKQSEEITNLWKCELSELDNFMRSISSSTSKNIIQNSNKLNNSVKEHHSYQNNLQKHSIRVSS